jgi:hypothetical protein
MKILLDECVPVRLGKSLIDFKVSTVSKEGWTSLKNGSLMQVAIEAGFDVMLTVDKNLQYQQNLNEYNITIVVFDIIFNRLQDFTPLIPKFLEQLPYMEKKKAYNIK